MQVLGESTQKSNLIILLENREPILKRISPQLKRVLAGGTCCSFFKIFCLSLCSFIHDHTCLEKRVGTSFNVNKMVILQQHVTMYFLRGLQKHLKYNNYHSQCNEDFLFQDSFRKSVVSFKH